VVVDVVPVHGVAMAFVQVVDVVAMRDGDMAAPGTVRVTVGLVGGVPGRLALVVMTVVLAVEAAVVDVVDMVAVRCGHMAAAVAVDMGMTGMPGMRGSQDLALSWLCVSANMYDISDANTRDRPQPAAGLGSRGLLTRLSGRGKGLG
jgi:hypothetical protein